MDTSQGDVDLEATLIKLACSKRACARLNAEFGPALGKSAIAMLNSGTLDGDLGAHIHDFFTDEIQNEAAPVWKAEMYDPDDDDNPDKIFPLTILEYEGVYFLHALEYDPQGYFLSLRSAKSFALSNWDNIRECLS